MFVVISVDLVKSVNLTHNLTYKNYVIRYVWMTKILDKIHTYIFLSVLPFYIHASPNLDILGMKFASKLTFKLKQCVWYCFSWLLENCYFEVGEAAECHI